MRIPRFFALLCCLLCLGACSRISPRTEQIAALEREMPQSFRQVGQDEGQERPERWWEAFADPVLNRLIDEALAANRDLAQARARMLQAESLARASEAALFPSLDLGSRIGVEHNQGAGGGLGSRSRSLSVAARYELDLWGRLAAKSQAADLSTQASRQDLRAIAIGISAQVADLYFLSLEQGAQLALIERLCATLTDILAMTERRYQEGLAGPADLHLARQNLLEVQEGRPTLAAARKKTSHALAVLLGRFPEPDITGVADELPTPPPIFAAGIPADLLKNRPDIEAALLRLAASDALVAAAIAERLPAINLLAGLGALRNEAGPTLLSGGFSSLFAELAQPLFDAGRRKAEVERNEALFAERLAASEQALRQAVREVEDALAANRGSGEGLALLIEHRKETAASLDLAQQNYLEGLSDYLPVLLARQADFRAASRELAARRQVLSDRISLARALGGSWTPQSPAQKIDGDRP